MILLPFFRLRVTKHNVFGYFYDFWQTSSLETVIPYRTNVSDTKAVEHKTFVGFLSIQDVRAIREFRLGLELRSRPLNRIPAMVVKLSQDSKFFLNEFSKTKTIFFYVKLIKVSRVVSIPWFKMLLP